MFQGYNDETFEFFMAIRFNNNTDFFHSNRDWYLRGVREPSLALAQALGPVVEEIDANLERRPHRVVSRINRDIRFSNDKSPYRDYIWLSFHRTDVDKDTMLGMYFDISDAGGSYGIGFYRGNKPLMNAMRRQIAANPDVMLEIVAPLMAEYMLHADCYKRMAVPENVPDMLRPLYTAKEFYFSKDLNDFGLLKSAALADEVADGFRKFAPLYRFFSELTPEEDPDATVRRN